MVDGDFYSRALTEICALKASRVELAPFLDHTVDVLQAQRQAKLAIRLPESHLDIERGLQRMADGAPFLEVRDVYMDWPCFDELLNRLSSLGRQRDQGESAERWPRIDGLSEAWHRELQLGVLADPARIETASLDAGMDLAVLTYLAGQTFVPFLETHAERIEEHLCSVPWLRGSCPVCGGEPLIGMLETESGSKQLQCCLCRTQYRAKRVECPFCGNDDQDTLRFFYDEEDPRHRVESCGKCGAYLKVVDCRKSQAPGTLWVENLATIHLDFVAAEEGFHRDTNRLFGL